MSLPIGLFHPPLNGKKKGFEGQEKKKRFIIMAVVIIIIVILDFWIHSNQYCLVLMVLRQVFKSSAPAVGGISIGDSRGELLGDDDRAKESAALTCISTRC